MKKEIKELKARLDILTKWLQGKRMKAKDMDGEWGNRLDGTYCKRNGMPSW